MPGPRTTPAPHPFPLGCVSGCPVGRGYVERQPRVPRFPLAERCRDPEPPPPPILTLWGELAVASCAIVPPPPHFFFLSARARRLRSTCVAPAMRAASVLLARGACPPHEPRGGCPARPRLRAACALLARGACPPHEGGVQPAPTCACEARCDAPAQRLRCTAPHWSGMSEEAAPSAPLSA